MTYQSLLKENFRRRVSMNPRFSLRSYAKLLGLSPSKLSEILGGKKGLSPQRSEDVCSRLKLTPHDRELFTLSVRSQHSRLKTERTEAKNRLKEIVTARDLTGGKTSQKNAWYFGAVKALKDAKVDLAKLSKLGVTALQLENAERFLSRITRLHPERKTISFDPSSLMKRLNEDFATGTLKSADASFVLLTSEQARALTDLLQAKVDEFAKSARDEAHSNLTMVFIGSSEICTKEDLC